MGKVITSPMSGFMELLPAEQILFNQMLNTIRRNYEVFGFIPMDNPVLERSEVLLAKAGGETEKQIYRFTKGSTDISMRFDLTVPLARYVAEYYGKLTFPFRRYSIGKIYRGERPQAGRFREFYQADIDIIGDETLDIKFDAEIPSIIYMIFKELGFDDFTIRINNRKIFNGLFAGLDILNLSSKIMQIIDKFEKIGKDEVKRELQSIGIDDATITKIFNFINLTGSSDEIILGLKGLGIANDQFNEGVADLEKVVKLIRLFGIPDKNFIVDLTIARGLDYYTGTIYETRLDQYPEIGSVCSGGRYDDLASYYTKKKLPGVGISIGLTRLFDQLHKKEVIKTNQSTTTQVLIIPMMEDITSSLQLATKLRTSGIPTEISLIEGKMKKKIGYADKLKIPYVIFIGENEVNSKTYTLKDLNSGKQKSLNFNDLMSTLQN